MVKIVRIEYEHKSKNWQTYHNYISGVKDDNFTVDGFLLPEEDHIISYREEKIDDPYTENVCWVLINWGKYVRELYMDDPNRNGEIISKLPLLVKPMDVRLFDLPDVEVKTDEFIYIW